MAVRLRDLGKILKDAVSSKKVLEEAAKSAVESVKTRTRLGRGVIEAEGPAVPLPKLKLKTKRNRKKIQENPTKVLDPAFSPGKTNLTLTGHMIDSVRYGVGKGKIQIDLDNQFAKDKAQWALDLNKGYEFMNLSRAEVNRMIKIMKTEVIAILKRIKIDKL